MARIRLLSLVTPLADVPVEQRQAIVRGTMRILSREAQKIPSLRGDLAARMLAGNDLGLATHFWNETVSRTTGTANTYENSAINGTRGALFTERSWYITMRSGPVPRDTVTIK